MILMIVQRCCLIHANLNMHMGCSKQRRQGTVEENKVEMMATHKSFVICWPRVQSSFQETSQSLRVKCCVNSVSG